eukprot:Rmarinus@m.1379
MERFYAICVDEIGASARSGISLSDLWRSLCDRSNVAIDETMKKNLLATITRANVAKMEGTHTEANVPTWESRSLRLVPNSTLIAASLGIPPFAPTLTEHHRDILELTMQRRRWGMLQTELCQILEHDPRNIFLLMKRLASDGYVVRRSVSCKSRDAQERHIITTIVWHHRFAPSSFDSLSTVRDLNINFPPMPDSYREYREMAFVLNGGNDTSLMERVVATLKKCPEKTEVERNLRERIGLGMDKASVSRWRTIRGKLMAGGWIETITAMVGKPSTSDVPEKKGRDKKKVVKATCVVLLRDEDYVDNDGQEQADGCGLHGFGSALVEIPFHEQVTAFIVAKTEVSSSVIRRCFNCGTKRLERVLKNLVSEGFATRRKSVVNKAATNLYVPTERAKRRFNKEAEIVLRMVESSDLQADEVAQASVGATPQSSVPESSGATAAIVPPAESNEPIAVPIEGMDPERWKQFLTNPNITDLMKQRVADCCEIIQKRGVLVRHELRRELSRDVVPDKKVLSRILEHLEAFGVAKTLTVVRQAAMSGSWDQTITVVYSSKYDRDSPEIKEIVESIHQRTLQSSAVSSSPKEAPVPDLKPHLQLQPRKVPTLGHDFIRAKFQRARIFHEHVCAVALFRQPRFRSAFLNSDTLSPVLNGVTFSVDEIVQTLPLRTLAELTGLPIVADLMYYAVKDSIFSELPQDLQRVVTTKSFHHRINSVVYICRELGLFNAQILQGEFREDEPVVSSVKFEIVVNRSQGLRQFNFSTPIDVHRFWVDLEFNAWCHARLFKMGGTKLRKTGSCDWRLEGQLVGTTVQEIQNAADQAYKDYPEFVGSILSQERIKKFAMAARDVAVRTVTSFGQALKVFADHLTNRGRSHQLRPWGAPSAVHSSQLVRKPSTASKGHRKRKDSSDRKRGVSQPTELDEVRQNFSSLHQFLSCYHLVASGRMIGVNADDERPKKRPRLDAVQAGSGEAEETRMVLLEEWAKAIFTCPLEEYRPEQIILELLGVGDESDIIAMASALCARGILRRRHSSAGGSLRQYIPVSAFEVLLRPDHLAAATTLVLQKKPPRESNALDASFKQRDTVAETTMWMCLHEYLVSVRPPSSQWLSSSAAADGGAGKQTHDQAGEEGAPEDTTITNLKEEVRCTFSQEKRVHVDSVQAKQT